MTTLEWQRERDLEGAQNQSAVKRRWDFAGESTDEFGDGNAEGEGAIALTFRSDATGSYLAALTCQERSRLHESTREWPGECYDLGQNVGRGMRSRDGTLFTLLRGLGPIVWSDRKKRFLAPEELATSIRDNQQLHNFCFISQETKNSII